VTRLRKTPVAKLAVGAAAIIFGVLGLTGWRLLDTRTMAMEGAYQVSQNLSSTLEVEIRRDLETYTLSLQGAADGLNMPELATLSPKLRAAVLFDNSARAPQYGSILVIDDKGRLKLSSTGRLPINYDFGDRDFFLMHRLTIIPSTATR
jgi:hypothetical protein